MTEIHPAVSDSLKRLAELERRTPPGYPLGYKLQRHHYLCNGCGKKADFEILLTVRRAGGNGKGYAPTTAKEVIYALPVDTTDTSFVTPRCESCIDMPREPVPALPPYKANIKKTHSNHWNKKVPGDGQEIEIDIDDLFDEIEIDLGELGLL